jgi:hypothetical protein
MEAKQGYLSKGLTCNGCDGVCIPEKGSATFHCGGKKYFLCPSCINKVRDFVKRNENVAQAEAAATLVGGGQL